jgi:hypothetical protein
MHFIYQWEARLRILSFMSVSDGESLPSGYQKGSGDLIREGSLKHLLLW